ncbi:DUF4232 domain-containing protein [Streptomyces sp. NPDC056835]|uniref:DUF4232 domain-containing protein n=1 Tax=Streptomyces sp. NPDC056835 TaxID=3345956 RepID=UPI0036BE38F9
MRTIRNRAVAVAATALVASLALTACGSGDSSSAAKDSGGAAASTGAPSAEPQTPSDNKQQTPADQISGNASNSSGTSSNSNGNSNGKSNSTGTSGAGTSGGGTITQNTACTGDNTKVKVSQVTRPVNHLLLTVTNTGGKNCDAYYAPLLRFDEAQAATQVNEDSQPQAVVTLAPGESAYASISLGGGDGSPTTPAKQLTVHFPGRDNQGSVGSPAGPITLPAGTVISDSASVTYWQANMADALTW